jgi:glutathione S-transferase
MLKVWGRRNSFNVQKVMWLMGELGLEHKHIEAGGSFGGLDTPEFLRMNPHGSIPVIDDDGLIVWESHTIIRYLSARHGIGTWWISEAAERSHADRWMDWALATLGRDFMGVFWTFFRTPEDKRKWVEIRKFLDRLTGHYQLLDRHLGNRDYLAGDKITFGDIPAGTTLYRYFNLSIERPPIPNVEAWYARLTARPAYREHVMVPFEDLRGRLDF